MTSSVKVLKAEWTSYAIFSLFTIPICLLALTTTLKKPDQWHACLFTFALTSFPHLWLYIFKITLFEDRLKYRTLFSHGNEVIFESIKKAEILVGIGPKGNEPFYRMNIFDSDRYAKNPLVINLKPFSKKGLALLASSIIEKAPSAKINETIKCMSEEDLSPLTNQALKKIWQVVVFVFLLFITLGLVRLLIINFISN